MGQSNYFKIHKDVLCAARPNALENERNTLKQIFCRKFNKIKRTKKAFCSKLTIKWIITIYLCNIHNLLIKIFWKEK
jgi:hypothetical protein